MAAYTRGLRDLVDRNEKRMRGGSCEANGWGTGLSVEELCEKAERVELVAIRARFDNRAATGRAYDCSWEAEKERLGDAIWMGTV